MARDLYNLNLYAKLMVLLRLYNLTIAAIAEASLVRISAEQTPSLHSISESNFSVRSNPLRACIATVRLLCPSGLV